MMMWKCRVRAISKICYYFGLPHHHQLKSEITTKSAYQVINKIKSYWLIKFKVSYFIFQKQNSQNRRQNTSAKKELQKSFSQVWPISYLYILEAHYNYFIFCELEMSDQQRNKGKTRSKGHQKSKISANLQHTQMAWPRKISIQEHNTKINKKENKLSPIQSQFSAQALQSPKRQKKRQDKNVFEMQYNTFLQEIDMLKKTVNQKDAIINEKNAAINEKNAVINQKNAALNQKNAAINQKNAVINQKNAVIKQKNAAINQKNAAINQKNAAIKQNMLIEIKMFYSTYYLHSKMSFLQQISKISKSSKQYEESYRTKIQCDLIECFIQKIYYEKDKESIKKKLDLILRQLKEIFENNPLDNVKFSILQMSQQLQIMMKLRTKLFDINIENKTDITSYKHLILNSLFIKQSYWLQSQQFRDSAQQVVNTIKKSWFIRYKLSHFIFQRYKILKKGDKKTFSYIKSKVDSCIGDIKVYFIDYNSSLKSVTLFYKDFPIFINLLPFISLNNIEAMKSYIMIVFCHQLPHCVFRKIELANQVQDSLLRLQKKDENTAFCGEYLFDRYLFSKQTDERFKANDYENFKELLSHQTLPAGFDEKMLNTKIPAQNEEINKNSQNNRGKSSSKSKRKGQSKSQRKGQFNSSPKLKNIQLYDQDLIKLKQELNQKKKNVGLITKNSQSYYHSLVQQFITTKISIKEDSISDGSKEQQQQKPLETLISEFGKLGARGSLKAGRGSLVMKHLDSENSYYIYKDIELGQLMMAYRHNLKF